MHYLRKGILLRWAEVFFTSGVDYLNNADQLVLFVILWLCNAFG